MKKCYLLIALMLVCAAAGALAENEHEHDWALNRSSTEHWLICRICGEKTEQEPHYTVCIDENPTECIACGLKKSEGAVIDEWVHYVPDEAIDHDELFHWRYCLLCGEIVEIGLHESTCQFPETCSVCHATTEEGAHVPFTPHDFKFTWNEFAHYNKCAVCGLQENYEEHYRECDDPDETPCRGCGQRPGDVYIQYLHHRGERMGCNAQKHFRTCDVCGSVWDEYSHGADCLAPEACSVCGMKAADGAVYEIFHPWEWKFDSKQHWKECAQCGEIKDLGDHAHFCGDPAPEYCVICWAWAEQDGVEITAIQHDIQPHQYRWDEKEHWNYCTGCDLKTNQAPHQFVDGVCSVCWYRDPDAELLPAGYTLESVIYDHNAVTGKLVHKEYTREAEKLSVRVTFFITGNYYMATAAEVEPDGTFIVEGVGPIEYITVLATGQDTGAPQEGVKALDAAEIILIL